MEKDNMPPRTVRDTENSIQTPYAMPGRAPKRGLYTLIGVVALLTLVGFVVRSQYPRIRYADVYGLKYISSEEALAAAGIDAYTSYFSLSEEKVKKQLNGSLYLEFVSLEKLWPNAVVLTVNERVPTANVLFLGNQYVVAQDGMVLQSSGTLNLSNGCVKVTGLEVRDIRVGAKITCASSAQLTAMTEVLAELELQGVLDKVSELNLSSLENIYLVTMDGYTANLGDNSQLRAKIGTVRAVVQELRKRGLRGGMIEATVPGQASYRPVQ